MSNALLPPESTEKQIIFSGLEWNLTECWWRKGKENVEKKISRILLGRQLKQSHRKWFESIAWNKVFLFCSSIKRLVHNSLLSSHVEVRDENSWFTIFFVIRAASNLQMDCFTKMHLLDCCVGPKCPFPKNQCYKSLFDLKLGPHKPSESIMLLSYTTVTISLKSEVWAGGDSFWTRRGRKRLFFPFPGHEAIPGYGDHAFWIKTWGIWPNIGSCFLWKK